MNTDLFFTGFAGESIKLAAQFINPFPGNVPDRKLSPRELQRSLRQALAAEEEAVHFYEAVADATEDQLSRKVLQSIADEERVHVGEFQRLLSKLVANEDRLLEEGRKEVDDMAGEKKGAAAKPQPQMPISPFEYVRGAKTFRGIYRKAPLMERIQMRRGLMQSLFNFLSSTPQGTRYALKAIGGK